MPIRNSALLLLLFLLISQGSFAQSKLRKADNLFMSFAFAEAIPLYKSVVMNTSSEEGDVSGLEASIRLAECYRLTNQMEKAEPYYAKAVEQENVLPEFILYYAQALQSNGKCAEAINWYRRYNYLKPGDSRGMELQSGCADITDLVGTGSDYELLPVSFNTSFSEFSPFIYSDGLVFTSTRQQKKNAKSDGWTGEGYTDLFYTQGDKDRFSTVALLSDNLTSEWNDGPASFNGTGNTIYFSRNPNKKKERAGHGGVSMQLYKAGFADGTWGKSEKLPFSDTGYDDMHPAISADGSVLYFSSNRTGGKGGMDIWKVEYGQNGWSEPINLGPEINSPGNEVFPYIHDDGNLFFSSDGLRGLGGLDIYEAKWKGGRFSEVVNMRSPINSTRDDFGLVFDPDKNRGYFSSNRAGGRGGDDIYSLAKFPLFAEGILVADGTMDPLADARIIMTRDGNQLQQVRTDSEGKFALRVAAFEKYTVTAYREGYNASEVVLETSRENPDKLIIALEKLIDPNNALNLEVKIIGKNDKLPLYGARLFLRNEADGNVQTLETDRNGVARLVIDNRFSYTIAGDKDKYFNLSERISPSMMTGRNLTRVLELVPYEINVPKIFQYVRYDHAQTELSLDARVELDKLARLMLENPTMVVEIGSHTDANGSDATNNRVSSLRAREVVDYLISQGVSTERLVALGYGEQNLLNHCSNGVICPENLHHENRRTEWKILTY